MKPLQAIIVVIGVIIVLGTIGAIMASVVDFQTEEISQDFTINTEVSETTASIVLGKSLWDDSVAYATITSDNSEDMPYSDNYTASTRTLNVAGLADNTSRTITIDYHTSGLDDFTGASEGIHYLPTVLVIGLIVIVVLVIVFLFARR